MKRFTVTSGTHTGPVDADHFSVNGSTGGIQFYRYSKPLREGSGMTNKDDLVAAVPSGSFVVLDEKTKIFDATLGDLSDDILDKLAEALGVDVLLDTTAVRLAVTFAE